MWTINSELPEGAFHILLVLQEPSAPIQFIPRRCQIFKIFLHSRDDYSEQNMFGEWLRVKVLHQQKADCVGDGPRKALKIPSAVYPETSSTSRFSPANATEPVPVCTESAPDSPVRKGPFPVPPPRRGRLKKAPDLLEGYHMFEYCIQRMDQRLLAVVKYPLLLIVLFVILRSLEVLPSSLTIVFILIMTLMGYLNAWSTVSEETLTVTSSYGIQITQKNILGKPKYAKFVPIENIKAVVINEIIRRQRVIAYLLITLEESESTGKVMVPLFIGTLPRLGTIENIYRSVQKIMF